jgi:hypothetical protein
MWLLSIACVRDVEVVEEPAPMPTIAGETVGDAAEPRPTEEEDPDPPVVIDTGEAPPDHEDADDAGDVLYGDEIVELHLAIDGVAMAELEEDTDDEVPVALTWEGQVWRKVGLQLKGSRSFRDLDDKAAFKIDFGQYAEGDTFRGVRHLTLNNMVQDGTMTREHTYYWLCRQLGIPAPRHGYARVFVNGELWGLYGIVETMDEDYVDATWPDDARGNLYEGEGADLTWARDWYDVQYDGGGAPTGDDIAELVDALESAGPSQHLAVLDDRFDRERLFLFLANDAMTGNGDGYVYNHHNYLVYHAPEADRWHLSPWGTDQSFRYDIDVHTGQAGKPVIGALLTECMADAACTAAYDAALSTVADTWDRVDAEAFARDTWDRIEADCDDDPRREDPCDPSPLFDFLRGRADAVRAQVSGALGGAGG